MSEKVRTVLIASGSGTDANSVMVAKPPLAEIICLLSTVEGAGCLEKAKENDIPTHVIARSGKTGEAFEREVELWLTRVDAELIFLLGCKHHIPQVHNVTMYNIHPAHPQKHGGRHMYGLEPHKHVLRGIRDKIWREMKVSTDQFRTRAVIHEAIEGMDKGEPLVEIHVDIPRYVIEMALDEEDGEALEKAAEELQQIVLPYEWIILPAAVQAACHKIIQEKYWWDAERQARNAASLWT